MKRALIAIVLSMAAADLAAQNITLDQCYERAIAASRIGTQRQVNDQTKKYDLRNASSAYLPQAEINAQATYQSDVVKLPFEIPIPGFDIGLAKDQYRATIDLRQMIYDGGYVARQRRLIENKAKSEDSRIEMAILDLKNRVSGIYLSIILADENKTLAKLYIKDIETNINTLRGMIDAGVASTTDLDVLNAEKMKAEQKLIELESSRKNLIEMLGILTESHITHDIRLEEPQVDENIDTDNSRPEYDLFKTERDGLKIQQTIVGSKNLPKAYAFASAGSGRPGLNMLSNRFEWFAMAGVKLTVPLTEWTSTGNVRRSLQWRERLVEASEKEFTQNNQIQIRSEKNKIEKIRQLIESDRIIVEIRQRISQAESEKLLSGTTTSTQYVIQINAQNQAEQNLKLHKIELIQAIIGYKTALGK